MFAADKRPSSREIYADQLWALSGFYDLEKPEKDRVSLSSIRMDHILVQMPGMM
jgi:hypothetical protein